MAAASAAGDIRPALSKVRLLCIFTDFEPDDAAGIIVLLKHAAAQGTSVCISLCRGYPLIKRAELSEIVTSMNLPIPVAVLLGTPNVERAYEEEGVGVLAPEFIQQLKEQPVHNGDETRFHMTAAMSTIITDPTLEIHVVILGAATDFCRVFLDEPIGQIALRQNVSQVWIQGGEARTAPGFASHGPSFNFRCDLDSAKRMMDALQVPGARPQTFLLSSHLLSMCGPSSFSESQFPELYARFKNCPKKYHQVIMQKIINWNKRMARRAPELAAREGILDNMTSSICSADINLATLYTMYTPYSYMGPLSAVDMDVEKRFVHIHQMSDDTPGPRKPVISIASQWIEADAWVKPFVDKYVL